VDNLDGYSSSAMSSLLAEIQTVPAAQFSSLYGLIDVQAWADFVDIPLVWVPEIVAVKAGLLNVLPAGPYLGGIASGEANWGFALP
jgi:hypothetical protein